MSKVKRKPPEWLLNDEWGIKRDPHNWILLHKSEDARDWYAVGFYRSLQSLLQGWYRKLQRVTPAEESLVAHVRRAQAEVEQAITRLVMDMGAPKQIISTTEAV